MKVKEIIKDNILLARLIPECAWNEGLAFYSNDADFIQVGTWNYNKGKKLNRHIHNSVIREVARTHEVLYVRKGAIKAYIYDLDENLVEALFVGAGDTLILLEGGHGYEIIEDNTEVLEVKNGPYLGADIDRRRF